MNHDADMLRTRINTAIWDALDRQRIVGFGPFVDRETGEIDTSGSEGIDMDAVADAVIAELRPLRQQLLAYARSGVENGDMTPTSERVLKRILANYWKADDE